MGIIMKEVRITFETAKLAKEKGFNPTEYAKNYFDKDGNYRCSEINVKLYPNEYLIVSQSELQTWLRDEFKLHIIIPTYGNEEDYPRFIYEIINLIDYKSPIDNQIAMLSDKNSYEQSLAETFKTYEDALEFALCEALNLIVYIGMCKTKVKLEDGIYNALWSAYTLVILSDDNNPVAKARTHVGVKGINVATKIEIKYNVIYPIE